MVFNGTELQILAVVTFLAASVTGAVGYGFSSLTVPIALLFFSNKILNPALVMVALVLNGYVLAINRKSIPLVWKRVLPVLFGLVPGIIAGSYVLATLNPEWLKFSTYLLLLPLILLQAGGFRKPVKSERAVGMPVGAGVGVLYSLTTISGPPMGLLFNTQGLVQGEFRAAMAMLRVVEALIAILSYYFLGLFNAESSRLAVWILPSVLLGVPLGSVLIRCVHAETFRRFCMSYDAWIVGYGFSRVLIALQLMASPAAYTVWLFAGLMDTYLLYLYFGRRRLLMAGSIDSAYKQSNNWRR
jgi:uncharacterized membrane protein YfcA